MLRPIVLIFSFRVWKFRYLLTLGQQVVIFSQYHNITPVQLSCCLSSQVPRELLNNNCMPVSMFNRSGRWTSKASDSYGDSRNIATDGEVPPSVVDEETPLLQTSRLAGLKSTLVAAPLPYSRFWRRLSPYALDTSVFFLIINGWMENRMPIHRSKRPHSINSEEC